MKGLKLVVSHGGLNNRWDAGRVVDPLKQAFDTCSQLVAVGRRDEARFVKAAPGCAYDNDAVAETAGIAQLPRRASHKDPLEFAQHP